MKSHNRMVPQGTSAHVGYPFDWDSGLIRDLIDENTESGFRPAFLIIGKREAKLLRNHLGNAFGPAAVQCLKNTYYMGLQVVEDPSDSLLCVSGRKANAKRKSRNEASTDRFPQINSRWRYSA